MIKKDCIPQGYKKTPLGVIPQNWNLVRLGDLCFNAGEYVNDLHYIGITIDETYKHTLDNNAVRHAIKSHGSPKEILRGQIPITDDDLMRIPEIVTNYETLTSGKNKRGQDVIIYAKTLEDGITLYVEEIWLGRHELEASTLYKRKKDDSPTLIG